MSKYFIDPVIISLLFQEEDDNKVLEYYHNLTDRLAILSKETIVKFLKEKGLKDDDIKSIIEAEEPDLLSKEFQDYLNDPELKTRTENNIDSFLKLYFDELYPNLPEETKKNLDEYIKNTNEIRELENEQSRSELTELHDYMVKTGSENLAEAMKKEKQGITNADPKINLGGVQTNPITSNLSSITIDDKLGSLKEDNGTKPDSTSSSNLDDLNSLPGIQKDSEESRSEEIQPADANITDDQNAQPSPVQDVSQASVVLDDPNQLVAGDINIPVQQVGNNNQQQDKSLVSEPNTLGGTNEMSSNDLSSSNSVANEQVATNTLTPTDNPSGGDVPIVTNNEAIDTSQSLGSVTPEIQAEEGSTTSNQTTAVDQLQSMGIDLNDALSQPPQS